MKYDYETEEDFEKRVKENATNGICVFRDDANREFVLDIIDDYVDILDAVEGDENNGT